MNKNYKKSLVIMITFFMLFSNLNPFLYYTKAQEVVQENNFVEKSFDDAQLDYVP